MGKDGDTTNDPTVTPVNQDQEIALLKTGQYVDTNGDGKVNVGDTGNVTVTDIKINDAKLGITDLALDKAKLDPAEKGTAKATYTLTQADIDAGQVENQAEATGKDPKGNDVTDKSDDGNPTNGDDNPTVTPLTPTAELELIKGGEVADDAKALYSD